MQIIAPGRNTLKQLARYTPLHIAEWHFRRLLSASYWSFRLLFRWFASEAIKRFPPPSDGVIYVIGDGSHRDKRGKKHPATQKGKQNKYVDFFGIKFIVLMVGWDTYRIPVVFEIVLPKPLPGYQNENTLFRQMVARFLPPLWAKRVIVWGIVPSLPERTCNRFSDETKRTNTANGVLSSVLPERGNKAMIRA